MHTCISVFRSGSLIVDYEMTVETGDSSFNADVAKALNELLDNITLDINNQTVVAMDMTVDGKPCKYTFWYLEMTFIWVIVLLGYFLATS